MAVFSRTIDDLKAFQKSEKTQQLIQDYFLLKAWSLSLKEEIDALYQPIFDQYEFYVAKKSNRRKPLDSQSPIRITNRENLHLSDQEELCNQYYEACADAVEKAGYQVKRGHCPALVARSKLADKVNEILTYFADWMGVKVPYNMELRDQMLEKFLGLVSLKD